MPDQHAAFDGAIPANYDRYLGPFLFAPYAADLAARVAAGSPRRVLETACGTGIVTHALRSSLAADVGLVATDLNPAMLEYAQAQRPELGNVEWRQADATALPFPAGSFDAVVCQFGLMFVPDKPGALREALRVLRPGGRLLHSVWDSFAANPVGRIAHETIAKFFPSDPPAFYLTPYGSSDRVELERWARAAGCTDVGLEVVTLEGRSPSAQALATGLVFGNPVVTAIRARGGAPAESVRDALAAALVRQCGDDPLRAPMQAIVVSGLRA